ncbi:MAG TPA: type IV pilus secretin PilQ [Deferrisomatales bacterium]|nr:type IV pilus secretin PilQ [Deferrisomatales bacterium]
MRDPRAAAGAPLGWVLGILLLAGLAVCTAPAAQETGGAARSVVKGISISPVNGETRVRLESDSVLEYSLSTSTDPAQAVVALRQVTFQDLPPRVEVGDGVLDSVTVKALPEGAGTVTLALADPSSARAELVPAGLDVYVKRAADAAPTAAAPAAPVKLSSLLPNNGGVTVNLGKEPSNVGAFVLSDGRRLVVDADGVKIPSPQLTEEFAAGPIALVRLGQQDNRVRAVVEARDGGAFEGYRVDKTPTGFTVRLGAVTAPAVVAAVAAAAPSAASGGADLAGGGKVEAFGFRQDAQYSYVEFTLGLAAPHQVVETAPGRVVVDLLNTTLPEKFQKALDTSAFSGPVAMVAAYPSGANTRVVVTLKHSTPYRVERDGTAVTLAFTGGSAQTAGAVPPSEEEIVIVGAGGATAAGPQGAVPGAAPGAAKVYTGQRLSMDFVNADIRNVLRLIGDVSGLNVVAGDEVQGKLTVRLVDVPWDQALAVILKTRGLDQVHEGNIVRIAPAERLASEKARALEEVKAAEKQEPLVADILPVSYAKAEELSAQVTSVLSERGTVAVDARTNALLIKDVASNLEDARKLVARLDTQTPQVLIEARIVEVGSTFARDLGIQWGGQYTASTATGNATGWAFPHSIGINGATGVGGQSGNDFAINFPSAGGAGGAGAALGMTLGHINDIFTLDLRLSAIESSGKGRVISAPRVTTLDNTPAEISQGIEIPFTTATEQLIETSSIDYKLLLSVTPHVTADRSIIMKINVTKDAPSATFVAVDGTPAKETRQATTEVLVRDGETAVIGGIITDTQSNTQSGVPWLADIPGLGWLFKRDQNQVDKTEMIIFITPKIVNSQPLALNQ